MGTTLLAVERNKRKYSGSDERYTPPQLLERVTDFFGAGWFDPCPRSYGHVPEVNGLSIAWPGRVYCNPPYSRMAPWVAKFLAEPFDEGLLLCTAYTDTRWFQPLFDQSILFFKGRISFYGPDDKPMKQCPFGSALVYRGPRAAEFAAEFSDLGRVVIPAPQPIRTRQLTLLTA